MEGIVTIGRNDKRCFGKVHFFRDTLHPIVARIAFQNTHGGGVADERSVRKGVDLPDGNAWFGIHALPVFG